MNDFFANLVGDSLAPWLTGLVVLLLIGLALWIFLAMVSRYRQSVFVSGGRKNRLEVIDATAIDDRRRLVLVRRDEVEHLVMIGGHNDLVVEQNIGAQVKPEVPTITPPSRTVQAKPVVRAASQSTANSKTQSTSKTDSPRADQAAQIVPASTKPSRKTVAAATTMAATSLAAAKAEEKAVAPEVSPAAAITEPLASTDATTPAVELEDQPLAIDSIDLDNALADMDFSEIESEAVSAGSDVKKPNAPHAKTDSDASLEGEMEKLLSELTVQR